MTAECSTVRCTNQAAFATRSKPAWCVECIDRKLYEGGLAPVEPFNGPDGWRLTTCLTCGIQAHYRFGYTLEKNSVGEKTCRACYWRDWAAKHRARPWYSFEREMLDLLRKHTAEETLQIMPTSQAREFLERGWWPQERIVAHLDENGFDFILDTADVNDGNDPVVARCRACQKIQVAQVGDFGYGCTCSRNIRAANPTSPRAKRQLLIDSDSPAMAWWDHERNEAATLQTVTVRAVRECHWVCPECGARFVSKVNDMAGGPSCPDCSARRSEQWTQEYARWKTTSVAQVPELAAAWAGEEDPTTVMVVGGWHSSRFRCSQGHYPRIAPLRFLQAGCPHCRGAQTAENKRWLADTLPEIAAQWHPDRNGKLTPSTVVWDSKRTAWWRADCCGHEWQEPIRDRDKYARLRCPACRTILGSLAWQDPGLAAEWSPVNPVSPWHLRPYAWTEFLPHWICATDPAHVWQAPLSTRSNGGECPECRKAGKSRIELSHHEAAVEIFGGARSGVTVRDKAFSTRRSWTTDIIVNINDRMLVIEYDGGYWHRAPAKILVDERKSRDLLAAGHLVVRLREHGLPSLGLDHPLFREIIVHATAPRPHAVMDEIRTWVAGLPHE